MKITLSQQFILIFFIMSVSILQGCATSKPSTRARHDTSSVEYTEPNQMTDKDDLRMLASLNLTDHGKLLLETGKYDEAISIFERSININSENAKNYYYLAEAWMKKGNFSLAQEFNRLAFLHTKPDSELLKYLETQKNEIANDTDNKDAIDN